MRRFRVTDLFQEMRLLTYWLILALVLSAVPVGFAATTPETSHLAFVSEYIRELAATEEVRASAEQELAQAKDTNEQLRDDVHNSTLIQLELRSQIGMMKSMHLNAPYDFVIKDIIAFDEQKIELHQELIDIASTLLAGLAGSANPGADYGMMAGEVPKIRASLEYTEKSLFQISPIVFATLVNQKPDSKNHCSHLIITKAERAQLIANLNRDFGKKLDQAHQSFTVSSASVLRAYFQKDFKCSDEPWQ